MSFDTTQNTLATNPYGDDKEVSNLKISYYF